MSSDTSPASAGAVTRTRRHALGDLLHRSARRYPGKLAVVDGDLRATFADFEVAVNRMVHALAGRGLAKGDRLALLSHNCWQYAVLAFATARAGVVLVPINFMLTAEEISYILGHSKVSGFIVEADLTATAERAVQFGGPDGPVTTKAALMPTGHTAAPGWDD